ncbi:hypothetical protein JH26_01600 [Microvirga sp. BSC39]|nr:hypothetical protein JH26_01600 [Microvirga sp. BSC39]
MRTSKVVHIVSCHAEGEVGDVIIGGVTPPPGDTIWEQSRFIAGDETLRNNSGWLPLLAAWTGFSAGRELTQRHITKWRQLQVATPSLS